METSKFLAIRCYLDLTQLQFAQFLGISHSAVSRIESGDLKVSGRLRGRLASKFIFDDAFHTYYINFKKTSR